MSFEISKKPAAPAPAQPAQSVFSQQNAPVVAQSALEVEAARAVQEVQAAMIIAKRFPRHEQASVDRMIAAARRRTLAEVGMYEYARGGQSVTGPSIRLAEMMAQNWGNVDFGIRELEQRRGESVMLAYCWDLETNVRQTRLFTAKHERDKSEGSKALTSQRDIYENNANLGARRVRACILGIIPGDVVEAVVAECEKTLANQDRPLAERVQAMLEYFAGHKVGREHIEKLIGKSIAAITEVDMVRLKKISLSISDGMGKPEDYFTSMKTPSNLNSLLLQPEAQPQ